MKRFPTLKKMLERLESGSPPNGRSTADVQTIADRIEQALAAAGLLGRTSPAETVRNTIKRALSTAGLRPSGEGPQQTANNGAASDCTIVDPSLRPTGAGRGEFLSRSFTNEAGTRIYKVYVPSSYSHEMTEPMALVVMLHGCTQSPDDFAAGTRMNALAERNGFLVAYPAQAPNANGSKCWNWFRPEDQQRNLGEPSIIAGITQTIMSDYRVDKSRVFVAGLSAGAAMAVVLGETYPDLYAAIGAHSGIPYGAAHDIPSAFSAMKCRVSPSDLQHAPHAIGLQVSGTPTIVFHGERDRTVFPKNGALIVERVKQGRSASSPLNVRLEEGTAVDGGSYSRTVYSDMAGQPIVEHWIVRDAGHAWSGGNPAGSYADPKGPDASAAMIRFFLAQRRAGRS